MTFHLPALTQADVGIAIGAGTDIAIETADVVIMGDRLRAVMDAHEIGRSSYSKTKQKLTLAFAFQRVRRAVGGHRPSSIRSGRWWRWWHRSRPC